MAYTWTMPSLMPLLLPWVAVLVLLALGPNRSGRAWWVLAPLGLWAGLGLGLRTWGDSDWIPMEGLETFGSLFSAGAFGFAAVLLLGFLLAGKPWPIVFLGMCAAQTLFGVGALLAGADADSWIEETGMSVILAVCGFGIMLALTLAGLVCRRRYRPSKLCTWVLVWLVAGWGLLAVTFCVIAALGEAFGSWPAVFLGAGMMAAGCFLAILPFLILCFVNSFYRERLHAMLGIRSQAPDPPPLAGLTPTPQAA